MLIEFNGACSIANSIVKTGLFLSVNMMINNHCLDQAQQVMSPNVDERPDEEDISLLVIHCISLPPGEFGGEYIQQLFCNQLHGEKHPYFAEIQQLKVSAHVLIRRSGDIIQFAPFNKRAWHAGQSSYQGRERCNDFSIGIELEGTESTPYTERQYAVLNEVIDCLCANYAGLNRERIAGHNDIAPERKTDPGDSFEWARIS